MKKKRKEVITSVEILVFYFGLWDATAAKVDNKMECRIVGWRRKRTKEVREHIYQTLPIELPFM